MADHSIRRPLRIGIDARYLSHGLVGGIHTYLTNLLPALFAVGSREQFVLYADAKAPFELRELPANVTLRILPYRNALSSISNDILGLRRAMAADRIDVAHFPANYGFGPPGAATVITLHDAINVMPWHEIIAGHNKDPRSIAMMTYLHVMTRRAVRQARRLLTVSHHARNDILRYCHYDAAAITVTPHGPPPDIRRITDERALNEVRQRYGLQRPFALADGLKNPAVLARAWPLLPADLRARYEIVFFARREPWPAARAAVEAGYARLILRPPRSDLIALFSMAAAFVFPSWFEGFGIPLLEAMICGAPVIASDRGAIPEVVGEAGLIGDAEDEQTLARHLTAVLGDPEVAERLRQAGWRRAQQFSWQQTARQTLAAYYAAVARDDRARVWIGTAP
ncbi:glycosyltransferase family 4 protein [Chloroflexus sp.]|uniref:glycosyltransferase family 4 protein n=1 Tax=Chloroflexus sp. TaxID=1904827 RepID=UPI0026075105|nr:glycosyltransferase family 1 protein [uncultured Chloroflexus sp.]